MRRRQVTMLLEVRTRLAAHFDAVECHAAVVAEGHLRAELRGVDNRGAQTSHRRVEEATVAQPATPSGADVESQASVFHREGRRDVNVVVGRRRDKKRHPQASHAVNVDLDGVTDERGCVGMPLRVLGDCQGIGPFVSREAHPQGRRHEHHDDRCWQTPSMDDQMSEAW